MVHAWAHRRHDNLSRTPYARLLTAEKALTGTTACKLAIYLYYVKILVPYSCTSGSYGRQVGRVADMLADEEIQ